MHLQEKIGASWYQPATIVSELIWLAAWRKSAKILTTASAAIFCGLAGPGWAGELRNDVMQDLMIAGDEFNRPQPFVFRQI